MTYFFIVGEASGDLHASNLIRALQQKDSSAKFIGLGGDKMQALGCHLVQHYRNMAFMGFLAVLMNLDKVRTNFRLARQALLETRPDVLVLVDYPSFNLRMAEFCRRHLPDTRIVYYIPPKIWAWKSWRVHKIARLSDIILCIFPFEPAFYAKYGYKCQYVGNPTMDSVRDFLSTHTAERENIIAILPGSRLSEIKHCLPVMLAAARNVVTKYHPNTRIVVTAAPGIDDAFYTNYLGAKEELTRDTYSLLLRARAAVVNSGTATLETALLHCPETAVYHIAMGWFIGHLRPLLFPKPFFTLVNIIPDREVIQELIAHRFTRKNVEKELQRLLSEDSYRQNMLSSFDEIHHMLGSLPAAETAANAIVQLFTDRPDDNV